MPVSNWIFPGSGSWTAFDNWSSGVAGIGNPDARIALISQSTGTFPVTITVTDNITLTLRSLDITLTGGVSLTLAGVGANLDTLAFFNPTGDATLTFSGDRNFTIAATNNLQIRLRSNTHCINNELVSGAAMISDAPISGTGALIKEGPGRLILGNSNSFTGGLQLQGGVLEYAFGSSVGTGAIAISNDGTLTSLNTAIVNNAIATLLDATGTLGAATISAAAGTTLTLTGALSHISRGRLSFGQLGDTGTIVASFGQIIDNVVDSSFSVAYYTLRFGDAYNAANLFDRAGTGRTTINGILDTAGFASRISNLFLTTGEIRSSSGALNIIVNYSTNVGAQSGTIYGTASADQFLILTQGDFSLTGVNFSGWSSNDIIEIYGNGSANTLTGSGASDSLYGFGGNDILTGSGGVDAIYADIGNDLIILNALNTGSFVDGGGGTDTLRLIGGGQYGLAAFTGFEAIELQNNSVLMLTGAQFAAGLSSNASVGGDGVIQVDLSLGNQTMIARGMTATGSGFTFAVNGSSGNDVVKVALNSASALEGFAGNDQLVGSDLADYIDGGADIDKIRGDGGGDFLFGGAGADVFKFRKITDSGTGANADSIADFLSGTDRLNFARIDTNAGLAGDQGFAYIGNTAFSAGGAAQIRWVDLGADLRVEADVNGDGIADMHVLLTGAGAQTLTMADFVL